MVFCHSNRVILYPPPDFSVVDILVAFGVAASPPPMSPACRSTGYARRRISLRRYPPSLPHHGGEREREIAISDICGSMTRRAATGGFFHRASHRFRFLPPLRIVFASSFHAPKGALPNFAPNKLPALRERAAGAEVKKGMRAGGQDGRLGVV